MPATTLDEIYKFCLNKPLNQQELTKLYVADSNEIRGLDFVKRLIREFRRTESGSFMKAYLMGQHGVGKTTELVRLTTLLSPTHQTIWVNGDEDLHPVFFESFDILYLIMIKVVEETQRETHKLPSHNVLEQLRTFFLSQASKDIRNLLDNAGLVDPESKSENQWIKWAVIFNEMKGQIKFPVGRTESYIKFQLTHISSLVELTNQILGECEQLLTKENGKHWFFVFDGFEKAGVAIKNIQLFFLTSPNILQELNTNWIFTTPLILGYTEARKFQLPLYLIRPIPVFNRKLDRHPMGHQVLRQILESRVNLSLFESGQVERLITASGGNLRDLFDLVKESSLIAITERSNSISISEFDVTKAISKLRNNFLDRLGEDQSELTPVPYPEKANKLTQIYRCNPDSKIPDKVFWSLLKTGVIQDFFDSDYWFGVHPLVVDILAEQGRVTLPGHLT